MTNNVKAPVVEEITTPVPSVADLEKGEPKGNTVPESDLLAIKDDRNKWKTRAKELEKASKEVANATTKSQVSSLREKYSDVDPDFLDDLENMVDTKAQQRAEEMIAPLRTKDANEKLQKDLDALVRKQVGDATGIDESLVDYDVLKALATSPQYRTQPATVIRELAEKLYAWKGKATTENGMRPATDFETTVIDKENPTKDQLAWLYSKGNEKQLKEFLSKKYS